MMITRCLRRPTARLIPTSGRRSAVDCMNDVGSYGRGQVATGGEVHDGHSPAFKTRTAIRWPVRRASFAIVVGALAVPTATRAQAPPTSSKKDEWGVWTSAAVGRGKAEGYDLFAGNLSLWVTHGPFAASLRWAGVTDLDPGDEGDFSLLVGVHPIRESHLNGVIGIGAGQSFRHDGRVELPQKPVLALGGQIMANAAIVGIGLDTFAGIGPSRRYYGMG